MYRHTVIIIAAFAIAFAGCAEGSIETSTSNQDEEEDVGIPDDAGDPPEDTGGDDPTDTGDDVELDCCDPGAIQCSGDDQYIECVEVEEDCGAWNPPTSCPDNFLCDSDIDAGDPCVFDDDDACSSEHPEYGEPCSVGQGVCEEDGTLTCEGDDIVCSATPGDPEPKECNGRDSNCDGTVDSEGICDCDEDQFGGDNTSTSSAADLSSGQTLSNLTLCPDEEENWFYLGVVTSVDVTLDWEEQFGPLGIDLHAAMYEGGDPFESKSTKTGSSSVTITFAYADPTHAYVRVSFETNDIPEAGTPFSISNNN